LKAEQKKEIINWIDKLKVIDKEFKRVKYELNESETFNQTILSNISDTVFITDDEGTFTYVHPGMFDLFGMEPNEISNMKNIENLMGKDFFNFEGLEYPGEIQNMEHEICDKNGRKRFLLINIKKVSINNGTLLFTCRDITSQRHIEKMLDALNKVLRDNSINVENLYGCEDGHGPLQIVCDSLVGICGYSYAWIALFDKSNNLRFINQSGLDDKFMRISRQLKQGELTECVKKVLDKSDVVVTRDTFINCSDCILAPDYGGSDALSVRLEYGEVVYGLLTVSIPGELYFSKDERYLFQELGKNISYAIYNAELKNKKNKIEEKVRIYQDQLRSMASQITLAEERERHRIAVDLHDSIGQNLAIAKIKLNTLEESHDYNEAVCLIKEIRDLIDQTICSTRSLTFELSPPILYEFGLESALEWLSENISSRHGIAIKHVNDGKPKPVTEQIGVLIFQMVRELLLNVVKHAKANLVNLYVMKKKKNLQILVEDNGKGFNYSRSKVDFSRNTMGFGLFSIRERLDCIGGELEVKTKPGHGTKAIIKVPLNSPHE
jgi:PAS domain S-box-containing protein